MKTKHVLFSLLIGALAVSGCKTDSEDDLPGWGGNIDDKPFNGRGFQRDMRQAKP